MHAEVMLRNGANATAEALMAHAKSRLAGYKAPKSITLVPELPVSPVGKVLRRMVREKYWRGRDRNVA